MTNHNNLQEQLESFKLQMKEVNESLVKFEYQFAQEKAKVKKLHHSFATIIKLINHELIEAIGSADFLASRMRK